MPFITYIVPSTSKIKWFICGVCSFAIITPPYTEQLSLGEYVHYSDIVVVKKQTDELERVITKSVYDVGYVHIMV